MFNSFNVCVASKIYDMLLNTSLSILSLLGWSCGLISKLDVLSMGDFWFL